MLTADTSKYPVCATEHAEAKTTLSAAQRMQRRQKTTLSVAEWAVNLKIHWKK